MLLEIHVVAEIRELGVAVLPLRGGLWRQPEEQKTGEERRDGDSGGGHGESCVGGTPSI